MGPDDRVVDLTAAEWVADLDRAVADLRRDNERLRRQLSDRAVVERAKLVMTIAASLGEDKAFRLLHRRARDERRPVGEVAREILERTAEAACGSAGRGRRLE